MHRFFCILAIIAVLALRGVAFAEESNPEAGQQARFSQQSNSEIWNEAVETYRNGEIEKSAGFLSRIILTKDFGPRAAELMAAIEYDKTRDPNNKDALSSLESAAKNAQIALRANPGDKRLERNFARAASPLEELRKTRKINKLQEEAKGKNAGVFLKKARNSTFALMDESATFITNSAPKRIDISDRLANEAARIQDEVVKAKIALNANDAAYKGSDAGQEEVLSALLRRLDGVLEVLQQGEKALSDISSQSSGAISSAESELHEIYKIVMPPIEAFSEGWIAQSNAWLDVETLNGRPWQKESFDCANIFRFRLDELFREYDEASMASTNAVKLTEETKENIRKLADSLVAVQNELLQEELPPKQEESLAIFGEIEKLLPKSPSPPTPDKEENKDKDDQKASNSNNSSDRQNGDETNPEDSSSENEENTSEEQKEEPQNAKESSDEEQDAAERQLERLLAKPQERSDEFDKRKKEEYSKRLTPKDERDW